jgi:hypothetical protein
MSTQSDLVQGAFAAVLATSTDASTREYAALGADGPQATGTPEELEATLVNGLLPFSGGSRRYLTPSRATR